MCAHTVQNSSMTLQQNFVFQIFWLHLMIIVLPNHIASGWSNNIALLTALLLKPEAEADKAECRVGMEKCRAGAKNVGVLRRAEDLASTYVLHPRCRNQLSSISEQGGARWSVDGKEDVVDGVADGIME